MAHVSYRQRCLAEADAIADELTLVRVTVEAADALPQDTLGVLRRARLLVARMRQRFTCTPCEAIDDPRDA